MGQPVAVIEKPSTTPGVVRYELNRSLTGMGHERYASAADAVGNTPAAVLARRLFETGQVQGIHAYANVVTVDLRKGFGAEGLGEIVQDLYVYYLPGVLPPSIEDLMVAAGEPEPGVAAPSGGEAGGAALSAAASRVPAELLERSRQARERWKAKQAD